MLVKSLLVLVIVIALLAIFQQFGVTTNIQVLDTYVSMVNSICCPLAR
jgi:hypothetical protein